MKTIGKLNNQIELQKAVSESNSKAEVLRYFNIVAAGGNYKTLQKYIEKFNIDTSHFTGAAWNQGERFIPFGIRFNMEDILVENSTYTSTSNLRTRLISEGYKKYICEKCNLTEWNKMPIPLELDHINGINNDHRIENLRLLCPNCHAQTDTYRGKNLKRNKSGCDETGST